MSNHFRAITLPCIGGQIVNRQTVHRPSYFLGPVGNFGRLGAFLRPSMIAFVIPFNLLRTSCFAFPGPNFKLAFAESSKLGPLVFLIGAFNNFLPADASVLMRLLCVPFFRILINFLFKYLLVKWRSGLKHSVLTCGLFCVNNGQ